MNKYEIYIFDFDLTLADTRPALDICYSKAFESIGEGDRYFSKDIDFYAGHGFDELFKIMNIEFYGEKRQKFIDAFYSIPKNILAKESKLFEDALALLNNIKERGNRASIVTGNSKNTVINLLNKYGLVGEFDEIVGNEDYNKWKPNPEGINICMDRLGIRGKQKEKVVYVGDHENDSIAAQRAGIDYIIVDRVSNEKIKLPKGVVRSLTEIIE